MLILLGLALSEGTFLVTYFTRFSEEIFTGVVAIFFIAEAIRNIVEVRTVTYGVHVLGTGDALWRIHVMPGFVQCM